MSCSVCRLPFIPGPTSSFARFPPQGILTEKQWNYGRWAMGMGRHIPGGVFKYEYLDANMFRGAIPGLLLMLSWESEGGTTVMCHMTCATLLRKAFHAESFSVAHVSDMCEVELVLGRPDAGRLPFVDYEGASTENVDLRPFWSRTSGVGEVSFDWNAFHSSPLMWTLNRPDIFPRFYINVSPERVASVGEPQPGVDILTTQSVDVLHAIVGYLDIPTYLALTSTCRLLRQYALTTFQPHARHLVRSLVWALPLTTSDPMEYSPKDNVMAHSEESPPTADWLLYLSHVHRSKAMRVRRWIWDLCAEIKQVFDAEKPTSNYGTDGGEVRANMEKQVAAITFPGMRK